MARTFTKDSLAAELVEIAEQGWWRNERNVGGVRNDGSVGNLLEDLLGIDENALPLPNANEWELKAQREGTASLATLFHGEPSPKAMRHMSTVLIPYYGWPHRDAGTKYPASEMSFRQTLTAGSFTDRGFTLVIDEKQEHIRLSFDASRANAAKHGQWLQSVARRVGHLDDFSVERSPYFGFQDLERRVADKLNNLVYVTAKVARRNGEEYLWYAKAEMLDGMNFEEFLNSLREGDAKVDFDGRSGHNHGTKVRIRKSAIPRLYKNHVVLFDKTPLTSPPLP